MKKLKNILYGLELIAVRGSNEIMISGISIDSKKTHKKNLFVAINGINENSHDYINEAIKNGATSILCEKIPKNLLDGITYVCVKNSRKALSVICETWYNSPSKKIKIIGITGTNGKTSVATMAFHLFKKIGFKCGLISTVEIRIEDKIYNTNNTTPNPLTTSKLLNDMVKCEVTHCFMEVSSHGIDQYRVYAIQFNVGVFTNLSHDHLDYHKSFKNYRDVKKIFFDSLDVSALAISNCDDKNGKFMLQNTKAKKYFFGIKNLGEFKIKVLEKSLEGTLIKINNVEVWTKLVGTFNIYNFLAVYSIAILLGLNEEKILKILSKINAPVGRFQLTQSKNKVVSIVDYAHTPDAISKVLQAIIEIKKVDKKLITVIGCGGNKDKSKRPLMGKIVSKQSDFTIFTSDNPRNENPNSIIEEILSGVDKNSKHIIIIDRAEAIKTACLMADEYDIILVAGKGHENYQEVNGSKRPFNDLKEINKHLKII